MGSRGEPQYKILIPGGRVGIRGEPRYKILMPIISFLEANEHKDKCLGCNKSWNFEEGLVSYTTTQN